ncbi:alpha-L-fucosidase [Acetobacteroides hydrogenigenes]|uniref:alpha-L-fucosidase n=1 Tax=Acetobacteroides hydrogenigenes TaxID=979970 RepID=A0A4R2EJ10_9BACT|nr:alpha-L-fucosidase [Acetobacteroides hydrogenigenes]TCN68998.1 alpha-L-fucosidase [Acetobacteroides hydrogenigenes]
MRLFLLLASLLVGIGSHAQTYTPTPENMKARTWFDSARFGMFVHWGPSSILGAGEWVMNNRNIHHQDYQKLRKFFNPIDFDAAKWVSTAKNAGMKYITLITRHHDGFSLWATKQSDFNIMNTPFKRDVVKEIADECHKQGITLFLYYSLLDWSRSDYQWETGRTGKNTGRTEKSNWDSYIGFMKAQLTELLTQYGEIGGIWFDGHWDQLDNDNDKTLKSKVDWKYNEIYTLIHKLQPTCLIGNNHHLSPIPGEDFQMFERDLPGENKQGLSGQHVSDLPLETCETINGSWGFNITDRTYKSEKDLIHYLVRAAGYGSNLLLNVGPMPNGEIQQEFVDRLAEVGQWINVYGATIYGTKGGFIRPQEWGCVTEKGNKLYIHMLKKPDNEILLDIPYKVKSMNLFGSSQSKVVYKKTKGGYLLNLAGISLDDIDTIIEVGIAR